MKKFIYAFLFLGITLVSCQNGEWEFPDYEYTSVYFAYQTPVRTIVLGDDFFPNDLDNERKCQIMATMGGVYENKKDIAISFEVDNTLTDNLTFDGGNDVMAMPENYYSLSSDKIFINKGEIMGGVEVQLTDAFFADPLSLSNNYVIPLVITGVVNADTILSGIPIEENAKRGVAGEWSVQPKDYILYAVKYVNPYHANYLVRGTDNITKNGIESTEVRKEQYVEDDEVRTLTALSLNELQFPMNYKNKEGQDLGLNVKITFDESLNGAVSPMVSSYAVNDTVTVYNISASGNGEFVSKGEKNSWGNKDRDALYLEYDVSYEVEIQYPKAGLPTDVEQVTYNTVDTLVVRDRAVKMPETFTTVLK